ncbi:MAG: pyridoxamine 5'-phosphate oxidase family protein [Verrucomicrobium sp.]|nr:pyridoxamine 5'-phosphate oxidase family protein [Verrucomicrobium sp.]
MNKKSSGFFNPVPYKIEESEDLFRVLRTLVSGAHPGILATVDEKGFPRMRWMASLSCEDFPYLYTLTSPASRKVTQLRANPQVSWMFFNQDLSMVVNLIGRADVLEDEKSIREMWNRVRDKKHAYFLRSGGEDRGSAVVRTRVERVECVTPENYMHFEVNKDVLLSPARRKKRASDAAATSSEALFHLRDSGPTLHPE